MPCYQNDFLLQDAFFSHTLTLENGLILFYNFGILLFIIRNNYIIGTK